MACMASHERDTKVQTSCLVALKAISFGSEQVMLRLGSSLDDLFSTIELHQVLSPILFLSRWCCSPLFASIHPSIHPCIRVWVDGRRHSTADT
jgi:hypothetical protein